jgi:hypothetical protein
MESSDPLILRRKAETCLRLITWVSDLRTLQTLRELADELIDKANAAEGIVHTIPPHAAPNIANTEPQDLHATTLVPATPIDDTNTWLASLKAMRD